jgi:putative ferrous iron transport protein C
MLRDVQAYIADHGTVSVADLSLHFHTSIDALQPMLNKLSRKARIRPLPAPRKVRWLHRLQPQRFAVL